MEKLEPGTIIDNVNTLDLRKATAETIADIAKIGNVNILLYSRETAPLIPKLNAGNVNVSVAAPEEAQVVTGQVIISRDYFQAREKPVYLVVTGQVLVKPDVTREDLEQGLAGLAVVGRHSREPADCNRFGYSGWCGFGTHGRHLHHHDHAGHRGGLFLFCPPELRRL